MEYVPDTSVIVDGRFTAYVEKKGEAKVILSEAMLAEVEHQANQGRSIGFAALEELKNLRELDRKGKIYLDFYGRRPAEWQVERAKAGEIDEMIRSAAAENNAILVTGDAIQRDLATIKGIQVLFLEPLKKSPKNIEEFFDEVTSSVHLKPGMRPVVKRGFPGAMETVHLDQELTVADIEAISSTIIKRGKLEEESFLEMDMFGATVLQVKDMRIVITRPPFSDDVEITAVRPIVKLGIDDYKLEEKLISSLENRNAGVLVAGSPGAGKSTFVQALAEYLSSKGKLVKTMENPRDLQVSRDITQYTALENSMEKTGDILLLVRTDYTVFDEMRVTSDFKVYSDLRLSGVGMIGVVHATRPIDSLHRFIGRIELGLIPQVIDTVLFVDSGRVSQVLVTESVVKVPSGMNQDDLARPVILVKEFFSGTVLFEIYTFGEQIVAVPVKGGSDSLQNLAKYKIEEEVRRVIGSSRFSVKFLNAQKVLVNVPEDRMSRIIGKKGSTVNALESRLGIKIDIEPFGEHSDPADSRIQPGVEIRNRIVYLDVGKNNCNTRIYADGILMLQAKSSSKGIIRLRLESETGAALYNAHKAGKKIEAALEDRDI
ncbi:MAG: PINc/VapC family ATPase [Candidatus Thermoplasmatota archaeon]|nr:PINc/VapC family ATPase [Candidatus Thermoplasmatota archaeon]